MFFMDSESKAKRVNYHNAPHLVFAVHDRVDAVSGEPQVVADTYERKHAFMIRDALNKAWWL